MKVRQLGTAIIFFLLTTVGLVGWVLWTWPDSATHVIFCDVGQGDAILITEGFTQVLIDGGRDQKVLACLQRYLPWWDRTLELVVVTHADADHIGGLPAVVARWRVTKTLMAPVGKASSDFLALRAALINENRQGMQVIQPFLGQLTRISQKTRLTTLAPRVVQPTLGPLDPSLSETMLSALLRGQEATITNYNDGSIVLLLEVGEVSFLLTGDLEEPGEQALLSQGVITEVDILKAGHHGSKTSTSPDFLDQVQPEVVVISSGQNNSYGHPSPTVVELLEERSIKILRTDQLGSIEFMTDGTQYRLGDKETVELKERTSQSGPQHF